MAALKTCCSICGSDLRIGPCSQCTQSDIVCKELLSCQESFSAVLMHRVVFIMRYVDNGILSPHEFVTLAKCLEHRYPAGVVVVHAHHKESCIFSASSIPKVIPMSELLSLLSQHQVIGFGLTEQCFFELEAFDLDNMYMRDWSANRKDFRNSS